MRTACGMQNKKAGDSKYSSNKYRANSCSALTLRPNWEERYTPQSPHQNGDREAEYQGRFIELFSAFWGWGVGLVVPRLFCMMLETPNENNIALKNCKNTSPKNSQLLLPAQNPYLSTHLHSSSCRKNSNRPKTANLKFSF